MCIENLFWVRCGAKHFAKIICKKEADLKSLDQPGRNVNVSDYQMTVICINNRCDVREMGEGGDRALTMCRHPGHSLESALISNKMQQVKQHPLNSPVGEWSPDSNPDV